MLGVEAGPIRSKSRNPRHEHLSGWSETAKLPEGKVLIPRGFITHASNLGRASGP